MALDRKISLERFMGDWYVAGFIPVDNFLISEASAHNAVESYAKADDNSIATTYRFRDGAFDGPVKTYRPTGFVYNEETNAEWRMQFVWPFKAAYLIAYLSDDYRHTIIGVPDRSYVWLMTRDQQLSEEDYHHLLSRAAELGYDPGLIRRVPQRWPERTGS
jgi:apolipoprotein D and lipocalin family protein